MKRHVSEQDFRLPEFRDAKLEDYELRDDGVVVRKDRWEQGLRSIAIMLADSDIDGIDFDFSGRSFEITDVVSGVLAVINKLQDKT